jgi:hypothetical protein
MLLKLQVHPHLHNILRAQLNQELESQIQGSIHTNLDNLLFREVLIPDLSRVGQLTTNIYVLLHEFYEEKSGEV